VLSNGKGSQQLSCAALMRHEAGAPGAVELNIQSRKTFIAKVVRFDFRRVSQ
jgi:hypothetical protein